MSTLRQEKVLNLSFMDWDERKNVLQNRQLFQTAVGAKEFTLVPLKQIHSDLIHHFSAAPAEPFNGDASTTNTPGLLLERE